MTAPTCSEGRRNFSLLAFCCSAFLLLVVLELVELVDVVVVLKSLGNNNIGSAGAIALSTMLETNEVLQRLTLENHKMYVLVNANKIAMEGVQALAKMLTNNRTLKFLNLTEAIEPAEVNGHDTQKSVRLLANALETSNTCIIKLETNPVYDPKLERLLNRNMQTHRASQKLKAKLKRMRSDV